MNVPPVEFAAIASLDLDPIKVKLMHKQSGEGWSLQRVQAVEFEYRRFLYLMKIFPNEAAAPSMDVDKFWHYHILDTLKYAEDCQYLFGHFLHHFPYLGLRGDEDVVAHERVGERMRALYEETFGERYPFSLSEDDEALFHGDPGDALDRHSGTAYSFTPGAALGQRRTDTAYSFTPGAAYSFNPGVAYSPTAGAAAWQQTDATVNHEAGKADLVSIRPRLSVPALN